MPPSINEKQVMVLGIPPTYEYTGYASDRQRQPDYYAANLGGSLIAKSICEMFNGDYIHKIDNINRINRKYDLCVLSLATHLDPNRDISKLTSIVKKLEMPVVILAVGITAYETSVSKYMPLHPSFHDLLKIVSSKSSWIGARGPYSASVLLRKGFKNVVPLGCPTIFKKLDPKLRIETVDTVKNPLFVYHFTAYKYIDKFQNIDILGQDFHDEYVFTKNLHHDEALGKKIEHLYMGEENLNRVRNVLENNNAWFYPNFNKWYNSILEHDFVFGPRLHGCLAAIGSGIPAVFVGHDLRIKEIAEFFDLPLVSERELIESFSVRKLANFNFFDFNEIYEDRFSNFLYFCKENGLPLRDSVNHNTTDFTFNYKDQAIIYSISLELAENAKLRELLNRIEKFSRKNFFVRTIAKLIKRVLGLKKAPL